MSVAVTEREVRVGERTTSWLKIALIALRVVLIYLMLAAVIAMGSANVHPFVYGGF